MKIHTFPRYFNAGVAIVGPKVEPSIPILIIRHQLKHINIVD